MPHAALSSLELILTRKFNACIYKRILSFLTLDGFKEKQSKWGKWQVVV
jgi:hypothetical protein